MMTNVRVRPGCALFLLCSVAAASPAFADHPVGGNGSLTGGGMQVSGPDTLGASQWAAGLRFTFNRPKQRSDATLEGFAARHIHAHASDYALRTSAGAAYGLTDRLTIALDLPFVHTANICEGEHSHSGGAGHNEAVARGDVSGVGDATLLAKYRMFGNAERGVALIAGIKVPTGSTGKRDNHGERFEAEHQPGSGSLDPLVGLAAGTAIGPMRINASVTYQRAGKGAMDTRLGDRLLGGVLLAHHFGPADNHDAPGEAAHGHESVDAFVELTGEREGRQETGDIPEEHSGGKAVVLAPGVRYNAASGWSAAAALGVPVWQCIRAAHPDNGYRVTIGIGRSF